MSALADAIAVALRQPVPDGLPGLCLSVEFQTGFGNVSVEDVIGGETRLFVKIVRNGEVGAALNALVSEVAAARAEAERREGAAAAEFERFFEGVRA